ncbi:MAG TPA: hypothetical protein EYG78_05185 [Sulfurovum sp.]|nr:hypothetical protein [Sulfurovum sp.]
MRKFTTALLTGASLLLFTACGSSGGSGGGSTTKTMVPITEENADTVISSTVQSISGIMEVGDITQSNDSSNIVKATTHLSKLGNIASANMEPGTLAESGTEQCSDGGSVSYNGNETSGGTVTFSQCEEYGTTINGTMTISINGAETTTIMTNFSVKTSYAEVYYSNATMDLNTNTYDMSVTATGYTIEDGDRYDFENYSLTKSGNSYTFSGLIKTDCMGGWVEIKTNKALVMTEYSCPTAGEIVSVGNNSELKMVFNADMSVDISVNGNLYNTYSDCEELPESVCD